MVFYDTAGKVREPSLGAPHCHSDFAEKRLHPSIIDQGQINRHWLIGNEGSWIDPIDLWVNRGAFALDERPSLNPTDRRQNDSEYSNDARPSDHVPIKGTITLVKTIRRATRRQYSAEEKIRIVLDGPRGETGIAELCRRKGIAERLYYTWSKEFLEAGKGRSGGLHGASSDRRGGQGAAARGPAAQGGCG